MNTNDIVKALDSEISRLRQVRDLLSEQGNNRATRRNNQASKADSDETAPKKRGRPFGSKNSAAAIAREQLSPRQAGMSPEGKERIAAAQRKRWAGQKAAAKKATRVAAKAASDKVARTRASNPPPAKKPSAPKPRPSQPLKKGAGGKKATRVAAAKEANAKTKAALTSSNKGASGLKASVASKTPVKLIPPRPSATHRAAEKITKPLQTTVPAASPSPQPQISIE